jgi:protein SCO1
MKETPAAVHVLRAGVVLLAVAALAGGLAVVSRRARASSTELPFIAHVPTFSMPDQRGRTVTDETLLGQVLVVDFFYATCTTSCPMLTGKMLAVESAVAEREKQLGRALPVHLVSITLDPENDSPEVLRAYAERVGADQDRWSFLSGRSQDLDRIVVRGFKSSFQRADPSAGIGAIMHGEWIVLVDATGALRGFYAANDPERMQSLVSDAVRLAGGGSS